MPLSAAITGTTKGTSAQQAKYREKFVKRVLELLSEGYARLTSSTLQSKEETAITGLLVEAIRDFIQAMRDSPKKHWSRRFTVHEDPPVRSGGEEGKSRPRVDIRIEALYAHRCPRMPIEAKRLYPSSGAPKYTGADGMGCFLSGRYGKGCPDVVMLGYVQSKTVAVWQTTVQDAISGNRTALRVLPAVGPCFRGAHTSSGLSGFRSRHDSNPTGTDLIVHHVLLQCY